MSGGEREKNRMPIPFICMNNMIFRCCKSTQMFFEVHKRTITSLSLSWYICIYTEITLDAEKKNVRKIVNFEFQQLKGDINLTNRNVWFFGFTLVVSHRIIIESRHQCLRIARFFLSILNQFFVRIRKMTESDDTITVFFDSQQPV